VKRVLTISEVAEQLNISEKALRARIARGQFPSCRWGRRVMIRVDQLEAFLDSIIKTSAEEAAERVTGEQ